MVSSLAVMRPDAQIPEILLTWTTNFVNRMVEEPVTDGRKLMRLPMAEQKRVRTLPFRKTQPRQRSRPVVDLSVLNDRLGYFVRRLQVWVFQDFIRRLSPIDISPAQFSVLLVIDANRGLSQAELAATLDIERARLVRLLNRLERRGLTQRLLSSEDRRRHALHLTRDGQMVLARAKALAEDHEAALRQKLSAERYQVLLELLQGF
jgi:DNA-binding MarR family transcriptional regulator